MRRLLVSFAVFLISFSASANGFSVQAPADLPTDFTCASIYSDIGAEIAGDPLPDIKDEKLAITVERDGDALEIEAFVPREMAEELIRALHESIIDDLSRPNGKWKQVEVWRNGEWVKRWACVTPCYFGCDCITMYYPSGKSPEQLTLPEEAVRGFVGASGASCFTVKSFDDHVLVSGERIVDEWDVTVFDMDTFLWIANGGPGSQGADDPPLNGVMSRCREEIIPGSGIYREFNCCMAANCDVEPCDCLIIVTGPEPPTLGFSLPVW